MEHFQFPVKLLAGISVGAALVLSACNNNDTNDAAAVDTMATVDTSSNMMMPDTAMSMDSGAAMPSATDTAAMGKMQGTAKPNPAKKGKKGAVSITAPSKLSGPITPDAGGVYANVNYIPSFPGGAAGLQKYFDDNLQYPEDATSNGVESTVRIGFTIDENGKLLSPAVEGESAGYGLDQEALRVVRSMPNWNPGKVNGKAVKTKFVLPVRFQLN